MNQTVPVEFTDLSHENYIPQASNGKINALTVLLKSDWDKKKIEFSELKKELLRIRRS